MVKRALGASVLLLLACGPTVGDPCTTAQDCLGKTCLNTDATPGGYCTLSCLLDDPQSCPTGTLCVRDALAKGVHGCFKACSSARDCRSSYVCRTERSSSQAICIGPNGL